MSAKGWVKALTPVIVAVLASVGVTINQTSGQVGDDRFERVAEANCEHINDLKGSLREVLLLVPDDPGQTDDEFLKRALQRLEPDDCSELVSP